MTKSEKPYHILHIILNLELAGAQEVVRTLAEYQQRQGCSVLVCSFNDGPMRPRIEALGIKVVILRRPRAGVVLLPLFLLELARIHRDLARLVKDRQIDVVQTHLLEVLDFVALSLRGRTAVKAVFWTIHNVDFLPTWQHLLLKAKRVVYGRLYRRLGERVDGFIAVSSEVQEAIVAQIGPLQHKIFTVPNGVNLQRYAIPGDKATLCRDLNLPADSALALVVGRLTGQKGHTFLIEALKSLIPARQNLHALLVGKGELRSALEAQVRQANLGEHVHFLGQRDDIPALLAAADMFILPSLWEGLSVALLEAMAAAKPVIATAVSGTRQVMVQRQTGLIVPPGNSSALAEAVDQLLAEPERAVAMGQAARQYVSANYSAEQQAARHIALYADVVAGKNR